MKKSTLILAIGALAFASCKKTDGVKPTLTTADRSITTLKAGADDNQPKHSGKDDGANHNANDDKGAKHNGADDKTITVPAAVLASFAQKIPGVTVREWKLTADGLYKAQFVKSGVNAEAFFKADGTFVRAERI